MSKNADSRVLRYMLMRTVAPSMLIIVIATLFFAFFRVTALRSNAELQRQNHIQRMEAGFSALEDTLNQIDLEQRKLLNSTALMTLVNMYDDIDWYRRYTLQTELREGLSAVYNRYDDYIDGAYLYLPGTERVLSQAQVVASLPAWLAEADLPDSRAVRLPGGRVVYAVSLYDLDGGEENAIFIVELNERHILDAFRQTYADPQDEITPLWGDESDAPPERDLCLEGRFLSLSVALREDPASVGDIALNLAGIMLAFLLSSLAVNVLCIMLWYRQVYLPLYKQLIEAFGQTEAGNLKYRVSIRSDSPFFSIFGSYNHMMENMEGYVENNLRQQILVSRANLKQLQSQINPHFLYNSYYILYRLIKRDDRENSMRLASYLGQFFQYVTRNAEDEKRLREEVAHARTYAEIQRMRFGEMLEVDIEEPDEIISEVYVPRLILQPLLENAFKYVYDTQSEGPMVLHIGYDVRSERDFDVLVENSGGIEDGVLQDIRARLSDTDENQETTALINIHRRLKIFFGGASGLEVSRSELGGLCVCVHIEIEGGD